MTDHPITPSPELVRQWQREANHNEPRNYLPALLECQRIRAELLAIAAEMIGETHETQAVPVT